jgi:hypothetical protein
MKTLIKIIVVMTAFLLLSVVSCKKVRVTNELNSELANELIGRWKWIYSSGGGCGFSSSVIYPEKKQSLIYNFTSDSTLTIMNNNSVILNVRYYTVNDTLKYYIENARAEIKCKYKIVSDSLKLIDFALCEGLFIKVN